MTVEEQIYNLTNIVTTLINNMQITNQVKNINFYDYVDMFYEIYKLPSIMKRRTRKAKIQNKSIDSSTPAIKSRIDTYIKRCFPNKILNDYAPIEINEILNSFSHIERTQQMLSIDLKEIFKKAFMDGYIQKDISKSILNCEHEYKEVLPMSENQRKKFLKAAESEKSKRLEMYVLLMIYYHTGARLSEVPDVLILSDLDFKSKTIHLPGTKTLVADRIIPMLCDLDKIILEYIMKFNINDKSEKLFKISCAGFYSYFKRFVKKYKLNIHHNQLRHTLATRLDEQNYSSTFIQFMLGHSTIRTQKVYKGVTSEYIKKVQKNFK